MVLSDGVLEGRKIFGNIVKYIKVGASSNFGNMFSQLGASIFLPFLPMAPIQVLTNNLLYVSRRRRSRRIMSIATTLLHRGARTLVTSPNSCFSSARSARFLTTPPL